MKVAKEGEWTVSSPIYAGTSLEEVEAAGRCPHEIFVEIFRQAQHGILLVMDRCTKCIAQRARSRPARPEDLEGKAGREPAEEGKGR